MIDLNMVNSIYFGLNDELGGVWGFRVKMWCFSDEDTTIDSLLQMPRYTEFVLVLGEMC